MSTLAQVPYQQGQDLSAEESKLYDEKPAGATGGHETVEEAAARGHVATDKYGNALLTFDPEAERKLRNKIDLYVVPTVALLYLFCMSCFCRLF